MVLNSSSLIIDYLWLYFILATHNTWEGELYALPMITHIEGGIKRLLYAHIAYPYIFCDFTVLRVLGLKTSLKTKISIFNIFPKNIH